jgi:hypothetical protein
VSILVPLNCNVDEVNMVKVLSLVSLEKKEYSESDNSVVEGGWLRLPAAKKGTKKLAECCFCLLL